MRRRTSLPINDLLFKDTTASLVPLQCPFWIEMMRRSISIEPGFKLSLCGDIPYGAKSLYIQVGSAQPQHDHLSNLYLYCNAAGSCFKTPSFSRRQSHFFGEIITLQILSSSDLLLSISSTRQLSTHEIWGIPMSSTARLGDCEAVDVLLRSCKCHVANSLWSAVVLLIYLNHLLDENQQ